MSYKLEYLRIFSFSESLNTRIGHLGILTIPEVLFGDVFHPVPHLLPVPDGVSMASTKDLFIETK